MKLITNWWKRRRELKSEAAAKKAAEQVAETERKRNAATEQLLKFRCTLEKAGFNSVTWVNGKFSGDEFVAATGYATFAGNVYYFTVTEGGGANLNKL